MNRKIVKNCLVLPETDWVISFDTVVRSDISIVCNLNTFENYINKTPEIIFEIVSPSSSKRDEKLKFELYKREGVKFYILVYPDLKIVRAYKFTNNGATLLKIEENILKIVLNDNCFIKIKIKELFEK